MMRRRLNLPGRSLSRAASTRASTRAVASAGTGGSVLSSLTMRPINSSSCSLMSCTFHLREAQPKELTGALDSHFQRRYAGASYSSHFLVFEPFHMTQQEGFPLRGRECSQCCLDLLAPYDRVHVGGRPAVLREVTVHKDA